MQTTSVRYSTKISKKQWIHLTYNYGNINGKELFKKIVNFFHKNKLYSILKKNM